MSDVLVSAVASEGPADPAGTLQMWYSGDAVNWGLCPINVSSAAPFGVVAFNSFLWAVYRGHTSNNLLVSSSSNWQNVATGQATNFAPSATVFQNKMWIAYTDANTGNVELISSSDGAAWSTPIPTGQSSKLGPSVAVFNRQLWIAYIGADTGRVEVISSSTGLADTWSPLIATGQSSNLSPSLITYKKQLWIAYIGQVTGHVEVITSSDGAADTWSETDTGQTSKLPPCIVAFQDQLWVAFVGEASGNVELIPGNAVIISEGITATWSPRTKNTGQATTIGPSLAAVAAVPPVPNFGGSNQYVFASPQADGWPADTNVTLPPIRNLVVTITIAEQLEFDVANPPSFQLNCCAPPATASNPWKVNWQQYVLTMQPNATELFLHIQNFQNAAPQNAYAGNSTSQVNFPSLGAIPAGWSFRLSLEYMGDLVSGATCTVADENRKTVGTLSLNCIGLALPPNLVGNVDASWLTPIVAFQLVVVGYAEAAHTTFTSGNAYILYETLGNESAPATPLVAGNTWAASACAGNGGTDESSNCTYSAVPSVANAGLVQCFGAPSRAPANNGSTSAAPTATTCAMLLHNWNALEPKTNRLLLEYYADKLSACPGDSCAAAVAEIQSILTSLQLPRP